MFARELHQEGHSRRFSIMERGHNGWEVRDEHDERVVKQVVYTDWHRVERALHMFAITIDDLESRGWRVSEPITR